MSVLPAETAMPDLARDVCYSEGQISPSLDEWINLNKPSQSGNSLQPWFWVRRTTTDDDHAGVNTAAMQEEAMEIREMLEARCDSIANDDSIPVRKSAKAPRSKTVCREEVHEEVHDQLHELANKYKMTSGKWLLYPTEEYSDATWEKIVRAMIEFEGLLRDSAAHVAKIAAGPLTEGPTRVICVYLPDSWNRQAVGNVCQILMEKMNLSPSAFKADIYTYAGIDSKNPSKIKSSLYTPKEFVDVAGIKRAREEASEAKKAQVVKPTAEAEKQRIAEVGGFESDSEGDQPPPVKKAKKSKA